MSLNGKAPSFEREMTLDEYKEEKLSIFRDMGIKLTVAQRDRLFKLKTEIQVDNFAHSIIVGDCD